MARKPRTPDPRETVELRAGRRCEYCRALQPVTGIRYHLEHVFPESLGGTDDFEHLALACPTCNYYKSNHLLGIDEDGVAGRRLFNPRGRGTIKRLRMNQPFQIEAPRLWVELGIYP